MKGWKDQRAEHQQYLLITDSVSNTTNQGQNTGHHKGQTLRFSGLADIIQEQLSKINEGTSNIRKVLSKISKNKIAPDEIKNKTKHELITANINLYWNFLIFPT